MLYFSHLLEDEDTKAVIRETGMGVEAIEFAISENLNHLNEKIFSYQNRLKDMKCKNLILHGPFLDLNPMTFDDKIQAVTRQRYEEAYAAAKTLGAAKIVYHTCYVPDFYLLIGWAERMAAFFEEFLADKDDSIEVLMENVLDRQGAFKGNCKAGTASGFWTVSGYWPCSLLWGGFLCTVGKRTEILYPSCSHPR